jgi:hypothetical protein
MFILIWRGWGLIVLITWIVWWIFWSTISSFIPQDLIRLTLFLYWFLLGLTLWFIWKKMNPGKNTWMTLAFNQKNIEEINRHDFIYIPVQTWWFIMMLLVITLIISAFIMWIGQNILQSVSSEYFVIIWMFIVCLWTYFLEGAKKLDIIFNKITHVKKKNWNMTI